MFTVFCIISLHMLFSRKNAICDTILSLCSSFRHMYVFCSRELALLYFLLSLSYRLMMHDALFQKCDHVSHFLLLFFLSYIYTILLGFFKLFFLFLIILLFSTYTPSISPTDRRTLAHERYTSFKNEIQKTLKVNLKILKFLQVNANFLVNLIITHKLINFKLVKTLVY